MTTRQRNAVLLVAVLTLSAIGVYLFAPGTRERAAVDAVPDGAFLLVTIDLGRLRATPLARELASLQDVSDVSETCGFDPLDRATAIAVGVPEKPDGVFGIAVTTHDLPEDDLLRCAERMMGARSATPHVVKHGAWTEVEQQGILAQARSAKVAYRSGAPLLVARGDYLATMQAALEGERLRAKDAANHAALRKALLDQHPDAFFVATALLPKSVRQRVGDEVEENESKKRLMTAILAVNAVALSIAARGELLELAARFECETGDACATVRDFLERKVKGLPYDVRLEVHGPIIEASLTAAESDVARGLRALFSSAVRPSEPLKTGPHKPDEVMQLHDAGP
jgi:hypothetical protein